MHWYKWVFNFIAVFQNDVLYLRAQKMKTDTDNTSSLFKENRLCASLTLDAPNQMLKAMEELDAPENMPEGLSPSVWERFCFVRRAKLEAEQKVI